jgi:glyoxylase-like metal-dependent hydrolase (beta-lactamase superfamily II)
MTAPVVSRRIFLADLGRGALAVAVLGVAGCAAAGSSGSTSSTRPSTGASGDPGSSPAPPSSGAAGSAESGSSSPGAGGFAWTRVDLGFVSAYLLVRDGEAAVVDTGVQGSDDEIAAALTGIGLGWGDVGHVILTHWHADHSGSISEVLNAAPTATGYIGSADLPNVQASRELKTVNDGDAVFGLRIVGSPGHTIGHVSVLDEAGGVLVAGDALGTADGPLAGSNPSFTEDAAAAKATIVKLGKLTFETLLVGHGDPILTGASAQVAALGDR